MKRSEVLRRVVQLAEQLGEVRQAQLCGGYISVSGRDEAGREFQIMVTEKEEQHAKPDH